MVKLRREPVVDRNGIEACRRTKLRTDIIMRIEAAQYESASVNEYTLWFGEVLAAKIVEPDVDFPVPAVDVTVLGTYTMRMRVTKVPADSFV